VNKLSVLELERRFALLTRRSAVSVSQPPPRVVLSTEETCWIGSICTDAEKRAFVRARLIADPKAQHRFMHSQMLGTREGLLDLIQSGLCSNETDDMKMIFNYIVDDAARVAFDDHESMFATFARGFAPGPSTSKLHDERSMMCWDGVCAVDQNATENIKCTVGKDGELGLRYTLRQRTVSPLMWHVNGPSLAFLQRHPTCAKGVESAKGWAWATYS